MRQSIRHFIQILSLLFLTGFLAACTDTSSGDSLLYGVTCKEGDPCSQNLTPDSSGAWLTPRAEATRMECTHDHIQVGGTCELDGAVDSYIEYSLTRQGQVSPWAGNISVLREARCENGRYYLIIPRPLDSVISSAERSTRCATADCFNEYHLNARIFALKKNTNQYEVIATAPLLPLSFQLIIDGLCPN